MEHNNNNNNTNNSNCSNNNQNNNTMHGIVQNDNLGYPVGQARENPTHYNNPMNTTEQKFSTLNQSNGISRDMSQGNEGGVQEGISSNELEHALLESIFYNEMVMMDEMNSMFSLPVDEGKLNGDIALSSSSTVSSSAMAPIGSGIGSSMETPIGMSSSSSLHHHSHNHPTANPLNLAQSLVGGQVVMDIEPNYVPPVHPGHSKTHTATSTLGNGTNSVAMSAMSVPNQGPSQSNTRTATMAPTVGTGTGIAPATGPPTTNMQGQVSLLPLLQPKVSQSLNPPSTHYASMNSQFHTNVNGIHNNGIHNNYNNNINNGNNNGIGIQSTNAPTYTSYYRTQRGIKHNVKPKGNDSQNLSSQAPPPMAPNQVMMNNNTSMTNPQPSTFSVTVSSTTATLSTQGRRTEPSTTSVHGSVYYTTPSQHQQQQQQQSSHIVSQPYSHDTAVSSNLSQPIQHPQSQSHTQHAPLKHLSSVSPSVQTVPISIAPAPQPQGISIQQTQQQQQQAQQQQQRSLHGPCSTSILPQSSASSNRVLAPIAPAPRRNVNSQPSIQVQQQQPQQQQPQYMSQQHYSVVQNHQHVPQSQQQQQQQHVHTFEEQQSKQQQQQQQNHLIPIEPAMVMAHSNNVHSHQPQMVQGFQQQQQLLEPTPVSFPMNHSQHIQQPQQQIQQPHQQIQQMQQPQQQIQPQKQQQESRQIQQSAQQMQHLQQQQIQQQQQHLQQTLQHQQHAQQTQQQQQRQQTQQQQIQQQRILQHQYQLSHNPGDMAPQPLHQQQQQNQHSMQSSTPVTSHIQTHTKPQYPAPVSSTSPQQFWDVTANHTQPSRGAVASSAQQKRAQQLVSQFHTLASRLGISLPANVLNDLTTVAIMKESASMGEIAPTAALSTSTILPMAGSQLQANVSGTDDVVNNDVSSEKNVPSFMKQLEDTAEAAISAVENRKRKMQTMEAEVFDRPTPTPVRRKRKPTKEDCERRLAELKAENETLKRHLDMVKNKTARFEAERKAQEKKMKELVMLSSKEKDNASWEKELRENLAQFSETYSDYGKHRQEELFFHLNQLEKLAAPTTFTKMSLWTLGQNESFFTNPNNHPISGILRKELEITPAQGKKILAQRSKIQKLCNNIKEVLQLIADLKALCQKKQKVFSDRMTKCQEILTPEQVTKLLVWIDDNAGVLDKLCPGWGSERIRGQNVGEMVQSSSLLDNFFDKSDSNTDDDGEK